jgi:hypothetical protein
METLINIYWAYRNKFSNRLFGVVHMPAQGTKKGDVLMSYIASPFTLAPWEMKTDPHSSYWESKEIARLFSVRGYAVDCAEQSDRRFVPRKKYLAYVDAAGELDRLASFLPRSCKKVHHIVGMHYQALNRNEAKRLMDVRERRGATLKPKRSLSDKGIEKAEYLEGFGNDCVHATFKHLGKAIFPIPISVTQTFDFPQDKDFNKARTNFLYFSGGGAVLKGLDLTLEAF